MNKLLVLGIGNMLLTDDGVGVFASQELMKEDWPEQVTIREGGTFTQDIFYSFKGYSHLLVLDSGALRAASRGPSTGSPRTR